MPIQVINEQPEYVADRGVYYVERGDKANSYDLYLVVEEFYWIPGSDKRAYTSVQTNQRLGNFTEGQPEYAAVRMLYLNQQAVRAVIARYEPIKAAGFPSHRFNR